MQAIILAAGMGKRLGRYTKDGTKCMVQVNGKALVEYAIESLVAAKIERLVIVIGYKGQVLKDYIASKFNESNLGGMKIEYIENPVYDKTNNIYSFYLARNELIKDDTILLESDLIYKPEIIKKLIASKDPNLAVVSPFESWMDGTCTQLDSNRNITGMIDKQTFDWNDTSSYYKTVNIYKFSTEFSKNYYVPFLDAYQKAFGKNEYYEQVLKVLSFLSSSTLKGFVVPGDDWYEIDDPADLAIASDRFASGSHRVKSFQKRFGGYWRFPKMKDFCYLVNPYFPPKKMIDELKSSFDVLLTEYPSGAAQESLLAAKLFNLVPEHIVVGNGAAELISSLGKLTSGKVAIPYPTFNEYPERFANCETVPVPVSSKDFSYTAENILKVVKKEKCNYVLLINPDNPTGNFLLKNDVLKLCKDLAKENCTLIFDESFIDFADKEIRYTFLNEEILEANPNLIVIKSISKSYGVPGLRLGLMACSNDEYIAKIKKTNAIWNINSFGEYFLQIYEKYSKTYSAACDSIASERARFTKELSKLPGIKVYKSQANYVLCKLSGNISASKLTVKLLDKYNIFIKDLAGKRGFENGEFIRLAVRNQEDNDILIQAMKNELK
ncbi:MAG: aminotransferase class I/II-fold pyridoxal phosphate-dependent enzyme [Treponema sp.]|nr:aminotransferase class I/II-fold pyridoxal phosphate-dependent enzyme [Treponema sp.]